MERAGYKIEKNDSGVWVVIGYVLGGHCIGKAFTTKTGATKWAMELFNA